MSPPPFTAKNTDANPRRLSRRKLLIASASLPFWASCASNITELSEQPVESLAQRFNVCAVAYAVLRGGVASPAAGISGCGAQARADAVFQAASLTKPLVAYAALKRVLAGQLDLEAPVSHYLPRGYKHFHHVLARSPSDAHGMVPAAVLRRVTVAQLLNHTSGLPNWSGAAALAFETEPGQRWGYSGEGFVLLQAVLEAVTGKGLSDQMDETVFAPLGMANSSMVWQDRFTDRATLGTTAFGYSQPVRFQNAVAAASLCTTATDYARFLSALLANERLLSLTLSNPTDVDHGLGLQWGLGWGIENTVGSHSTPRLWQWGNNPGFRAFAMVCPSSKDGFVILTNSDRGMPLAASLAHVVLPGPHNAFRFSWVG